MQDPILDSLSFTYDKNGAEKGGETSESTSTSEDVLNSLLENELKISKNASSSTSTTLSNESNYSHAKQLEILSQTFNNRHSLTPCPFSGCDFTISGLTHFSMEKSVSNTQELLKHLLTIHNLVIDEVGNIANLHLYMLYWKDKFEKHPLTDFCVAFWMDRPMTSVSDVQKSNCENNETGSKYKYYMLTEALPEDKGLRADIWTDRLETVLEVNRLEREQRDFSQKCPLFCKEVCSGNRSALFKHMADRHSFHIGKPDNIVFAKELINFIEQELKSLKCIYCEKIFKDRAMLKEHMRKKLHKRINPLNPDYDHFYLINYLESGKTWQTINQEDREEDRIEEDWMELKEEESQIVCLFCSSQFSSFTSTLAHMLSDHKFNFEKLTQNYDYYQKIKIVNFIRRNVYQTICLFCDQKFLDRNSLLAHLVETHENTPFPEISKWDQPEFFFPTYENDQFLMHINSDMDEDDKNFVIAEELSEIRVPPTVDASAEDIEMRLEIESIEADESD